VSDEAISAAEASVRQLIGRGNDNVPLKRAREQVHTRRPRGNRKSNVWPCGDVQLSLRGRY